MEKGLSEDAIDAVFSDFSREPSEPERGLSNTLIIDKRTPIFHEDQFFTLVGPLTYYALPVQKRLA